MAGYWAHELPAYFDKWAVGYILGKNWGRIGRSGDSGFDSVRGVICHHDAIGEGAGEDTWRSSIPPRWGGNRSDGPVGNGSLDHDGIFHFWAAGAANTAGQGGPLLGSRGVIAKDNANRTTFNIEARNSGVGELWTPAQVDAYPRLVAAVLDWANNETPGVPLGPGDVWSHALDGPGWTNRKIDPATPAGTPWGPAKNRSGTWDMNAFRGAVFAVLMAGPAGTTPQEDDMTDEQAQQLAEVHAALPALTELHTALTQPLNSRFTDPGGAVLSVPWMAGFTWEYVSQNLDQKLAAILNQVQKG